MGPGTDIQHRLQHNQLPVDADDAVAMQHDIGYLNALDADQLYRADYRAIADFDAKTLHGALGQAGLISKNLILNPWENETIFLDRKP